MFSGKDTRQLSLIGTNLTNHDLATLYKKAHDMMRNIDGLQPQEAFDELLKFLFFKQASEDAKTELPLSLENDTQEAVREIRKTFANYVKSFGSYFRELWKVQKIHLSDKALAMLCHVFRNVQISKIPFDIRSSALKEFLSPEVRRGLGIYLTPDDVVRMMVEFVGPNANKSVYDPACGSGTFLTETLKFMRAKEGGGKNAVWGTDKNPRMLLLAELNMGHFPGITFHSRAIDAIFPAVKKKNQWPVANVFDVIFTNPPFGVTLDNASFDLREFQTCRNTQGYLVNRQQSEIVFIEKSLYYLKPGGILAIVLPRSVVTNSKFQAARKALDQQGYIYAAVMLPPETFSTTGTQVSTIVLFIRKYVPKEDKKEKISIALASVNNVGYDSTGRTRNNNQLSRLSRDLRSCLSTKSNTGICRALPVISKDSTFSELGSLTVTRPGISTVKLRDVVDIVTSGRTPPRSSYTDKGLFVVKVGNLTGNGINWVARKRNFISIEEKQKRKRNNLLMIQKGDILLTAAAHSPEYIAKKVDIVKSVPRWVGKCASFVGEVMMIRPNQKLIDPYILLTYLRIPTTTEQLQMLVRGQTAHLYPRDILELRLPASLLEPDTNFRKAANLLQLETDLNYKLNEYAFKQQKLLGSMAI